LADNYIGLCTACEKRRYGNKRAAKAVVRRMQDGHMVAYRCPVEQEYWHVGHLPTPVIKGISPRSQILNKETA
jgi:hypothetical protein